MRRLGAVSLDAIGAGVAVLTLIGEFHHRETRDLERTIAGALDGSHQHLVVDMRGVTMFGAPSLRALVKAALRARDHRIGFVIVRPEPRVWQTFELTGLDAQFANTGSLESAVSALTRTTAKDATRCPS
jgi:anti-anti-sigma factor